MKSMAVPDGMSLEWYKEEARKYQMGFEILMEYWDSISEEQKPLVDERLKEIGL